MGKRAILGLVSTACLVAWTSFAFGQGITTTPRPPSRPAATKKAPAVVKKDTKTQKPPAATVSGQTDGAATPPEGEKPPEPKKDPPPPPEPTPPKGLQPKIDLHGGAWLFWYQPFNVPNETPFLRLHFAHLNFDGSIGDFGLFFNASVRDTKMREFYDGPAWLEEGYFYYKNPFVTVKLGKTYSRFGLLWENSFYGNVHFYDGIKLDPNYGISAEGSFGAEKGFRLGYYGQFFLVDGRTNGSFVGRDTISIPKARRRNMAVLRTEPAYFWNKDTSLTLGLSGQYFQADMPEPVGKKDVVRFAADINLNIGPVSVWADASRQVGQHVAEYPVLPIEATATTPAVAGRASRLNDYGLIGGEVRVWKFVGRYNWSGVRYRDVGVTEVMHVPGIEFRMNEYLQVLAEYAYWTQSTDGGGTKRFDNTLAVTMHGYF
jgi:hypothetical protein